MSNWWCFKRDGNEAVDEIEVGTDESVVELMHRHNYNSAWPIDMPREYVPAAPDPAQLVLPLPDGWRIIRGLKQ